MNWDKKFLGFAERWAQECSKDPSTKVGAIVVRPNNTIASMGYNGFPRGVMDWPERLNDRPTKYKFVVHAEANAIVTAREPLDGCTMYCTHLPCCSCTGLIIQSGIKRIVGYAADEDILSRWADDFDIAQTMCLEANVLLERIQHD